MSQTEKSLEIRELEQKLIDLQQQVDGLRGDNADTEKTESIFAHTVKQIDFSPLKKNLISFKNAGHFKLNTNEIVEKRKEMRNVLVELLRQMPATQLIKLTHGKRKVFELDTEIDFKPINLDKIWKVQSEMIDEMINEQKEKINNTKLSATANIKRTIENNKKYKIVKRLQLLKKRKVKADEKFIEIERFKLFRSSKKKKLQIKNAKREVDKISEKITILKSELEALKGM